MDIRSHSNGVDRDFEWCLNE